MSKEQKKYYLYIDGQAVPVSEQVYRAYHHYARKEKYFTYDLKTEKFSCDQETQTAHFTPSREDSYERLLAANRQFASAGSSPEEEAVSSLWLADLMRGLSPEERDIITQLYILDKSERQACAALHLALSTFHNRKKALLEKLRNLLNENS
ncbi:MAG: hypothetical protein O0X93_00710 [Methanocorpusculum sp.]|nr:hypothetical protein [Methanocorpusculum sp.]MDE2521664.1 hypothetical protein [Methanocorpusculum sp.]